MTPDRAEIEKMAEDIVEECLSDKDWNFRKEVIISALTAQAEKHEAEKAELEKRVKGLEEKVYLPNHWQCPKCNFYQVNSIMHPNGICADKRTPENCPNDGTEMMPVTWKQNAQDGAEGNRQAFERFDKEKIALETLLSKMREEIQEIKSYADRNRNLSDNSPKWAENVSEACKEILDLPLEAIEDELAEKDKRIGELEKEVQFKETALSAYQKLYVSEGVERIADELKKLRTHAEHMAGAIEKWLDVANPNLGCWGLLKEKVTTYRQAFPEK